jgi:hypothetical protein
VYYVPQVLGVLRVFDRAWGDLFCYTQRNGCVAWRVPANSDTWHDMEAMLRTFWKANVLPARAMLAAGAPEAEVRAQCQPKYDAAAANWAVEQCARISREATVTRFPSPPMDQLLAAAGMPGLHGDTVDVPQPDAELAR